MRWAWLSLGAALVAGPAAARALTADDMYCAFGTVTRVQSSQHQMVLRTAAGPLTLRYGDLLAFSPAPGARVRVYYVLSDGALATRIERW